MIPRRRQYGPRRLRGFRITKKVRTRWGILSLLFFRSRFVRIFPNSYRRASNAFGRGAGDAVPLRRAVCLLGMLREETSSFPKWPRRFDSFFMKTLHLASKTKMNDSGTLYETATNGNAIGRLFFLEASGGRIHSANTDGSDRKVIVSGARIPDGVVVDLEAGHIYWTNMGVPNQNDGAIDRGLMRLLRGKPYRPLQHKTTVT